MCALGCCQGVFAQQLAAPVPSDELAEVQVNAQREKLGELRTEMAALEDRFNTAYNTLNKNRQFDVVCTTEARTGTLMVKRMVDTTVPTLLIALDVDPLSYNKSTAMFDDLDEDSFERAVDAAASWCWANANAEQRVLLTTTRLDAPVIEVAMRSRSHALDWLALVELGPAGCAAPSRIGALLRRNSAGRVVLVTGRAAPSGRWVRTWSRFADARTVLV